MVETSADRPEGLPAKIDAALDRLVRARRAHRQTVASRHGVTLLQMDLLRLLAEGPPPDQVVGALALELGVTQPTATDSLRSLERKGLVRRSPRPADRRQTMVALTESGEALVADLDEGDHPLLAAIDHFDSSTQENLLDSLLTLIARLVDTGVIDVARTCFTCKYHRVDTGTHHCALMEIDLPPPDLRVNCPEHVAVASGV